MTQDTFKQAHKLSKELNELDKHRTAWLTAASVANEGMNVRDDSACGNIVATKYIDFPALRLQVLQSLDEQIKSLTDQFNAL